MPDCHSLPLRRDHRGRYRNGGSQTLSALQADRDRSGEDPRAGLHQHREVRYGRAVRAGYQRDGPGTGRLHRAGLPGRLRRHQDRALLGEAAVRCRTSALGRRGSRGGGRRSLQQAGHVRLLAAPGAPLRGTAAEEDAARRHPYPRLRAAVSAAGRRAGSRAPFLRRRGSGESSSMWGMARPASGSVRRFPASSRGSARTSISTDLHTGSSTGTSWIC